MSPAVTAIEPTERLGELMLDFHLTAMAPELVPRLAAAGHEDCLPVLVEIFEIESEIRWQRKVTRLRRASKLPPAKTFDTFDEARLPRSQSDMTTCLPSRTTAKPAFFKALTARRWLTPEILGIQTATSTSRRRCQPTKFHRGSSRGSPPESTPDNDAPRAASAAATG